MKIATINITNYRCFEQLTLYFSPRINVFVGANNSGKTSILKCILELQQPNISQVDARKKTDAVRIALNFSDAKFLTSGGHILPEYSHLEMFFSPNGTSTKNIKDPATGGQLNHLQFPSVEPQNLIYPFLAKRKTPGFDQSININSTLSVRGDLCNLVAKVDRLSDSGHPKHEMYKQACKDILGFYVHCQASNNGKQAGFLLNDFDFLPIESMGEGVSHLLGMIVNLCVAQEKIFLIEELENDIHPKALKMLLTLIEESSNTNQFFISTHSNIILSKLGSLESTKIFGLSSKLIGRLPTSDVVDLNEPEQRRLLLEDLGYEIDDLGLWKGWLILEESSAETIINTFLIPWFVPRLIGKIRTVSSGGYTKAKGKFEKLHELFLYLHLSPVYKNKAWVILDGGESEALELEKMKSIYVLRHNWNADNFTQLSKHNFEDYLPSKFAEKIASIATVSKIEKRRFKEELLTEVIQWASDNPESAKKGFSSSAKEVIEILKKIDVSLNS